MSITKKERQIIDWQLGRSPNNLLDVQSHCPWGYPAILLVKPYYKGQVSPNIYWLSCPYLVKKVDMLEDSGMIGEFTLKLEDGKYKKSMENTHQSYAKQRALMLSKQEIKEAATISPDIVEMLKNSGVGGIREKSGIKCLHLHLADFLVRGENPVGKEVWQKLGWPADCNICLSKEEELKNEIGSN